jgi:hypothetical protein
LIKPFLAMTQYRRDADPEAVLPPKRQFITAEDLGELWDTRGMKYRVDDLHKMLIDRGLAVYIDRPKFRGMFKDVLRSFLVDGDARRDPRKQPKQSFPKVF